MKFLESIVAHFGFLQDEFGFQFHPGQLAYLKEPLSVTFGWYKGEIDIDFSVSLSFTDTHEIFRPYLSRSFRLTEVVRQSDSPAPSSWSLGGGGYITTDEEAHAYLEGCARLMRKHCGPLLRGDLTALEQLTIKRRGNA